jgi:hypothetical protein
MVKIKKLTLEQERELPRFREHWRAIGLDTSPIDPVAARKAVCDLYIAGGMEKPKAVIVLASPMACLIANAFCENKGDQLRNQLRDQLRDQLWDQLRNQLWDQLGNQLGEGDQLRNQLWDQLGDRLWDQLRNQLWDQLWDQLRNQLWDQLRNQLGDQLHQTTYFIGGQDAFWLSFYDFSETIGAPFNKSTKTHFDAYKNYAQTCGWLYPYKSIAFVSDRSAELHFDAQRRLHCATGMAAKFRDGWGIHSWHGLRIPARLIDERDKITPLTIAAEENAELRRVALEIYGFDRYLAECDAKVISKDELHGQPRRLLEIKVGGDTIRIIEVMNGSLEPDGTRRRFHLGAMPGNTPQEVVAASYGINPKVYQEAVRT